MQNETTRAVMHKVIYALEFYLILEITGIASAIFDIYFWHISRDVCVSLRDTN